MQMLLTSTNFRGSMAKASAVLALKGKTKRTVYDPSSVAVLHALLTDLQ